MPREKSISFPSNEEMRRQAEDRQLELELIDRGVTEGLEEYEVRDAATGKELEPLVDSPALNRKLLRNARKSPNEIAALTGMQPNEVAERLSVLLDNRSWRDDLMEEKLLLAEIGMLMDDIRERMQRRGVEDEGWASMARVQLATIKTGLEQLKERRKDINGQLSLVTELQAKLMAEAIKLAMERAVFTLEKKFPSIDPFEVRLAFDNALPGAVEFLEAQIEQ